LYNTIANGIRSMPAYAKQIPVADRWAIVAYVKALQRSQHATGQDDVPPLEREKNLK
jgi:mono/diheme cytochrome c family protein